MFKNVKPSNSYYDQKDIVTNTVHSAIIDNNLEQIYKESMHSGRIQLLQIAALMNIDKSLKKLVSLFEMKQ